MTKVYLATSGTPGEYGYGVLKAFTHREHAESYELGERVEEFEVHDQPVRVVPRYVVRWYELVIYPPDMSSHLEGFDGRPDSTEDRGWATVFKTWDEDKARQVFAEKRAARERAVAELVAALPRVDVLVWYEENGTAYVRTPAHLTQHALQVPRDVITEQAGLPEGATLHDRWFSVDTLMVDRIDGFKVCADPDEDGLAKVPMAPGHGQD